MRFVWVVVLLVGCTDSDVDTEDPFENYPDIRGHYNVQLQGTNGCENGPFLDWFNGPMLVEGDPDDLTFDMGDGQVMVGSVDESFAFQFGEELDIDGVSEGVAASGVASATDGTWTLDGEISALVDEDGIEANDCTIDGPFVATEID